MKLNGTSPFQKPIIDTGTLTLFNTSEFASDNGIVGFLNNDFDLYTLRYAFKQVRSFVEGVSPIKDIVYRPLRPSSGGGD